MSKRHLLTTPPPVGFLFASLHGYRPEWLSRDVVAGLTSSSPMPTTPGQHPSPGLTREHGR